MSEDKFETTIEHTSYTKLAPITAFFFAVGAFFFLMHSASAQTPGPFPTPGPTTSADIGTLRIGGEGPIYFEDHFTGANAFIKTDSPGNPGINAAITNSNDPDGKSGNAIIVTPIADPVIRFSNISLLNLSGAPLQSITLRLPQLGQVDLGFIDDGFAAGSDGLNAFQVEYLDLVGNYFGDYLPYNGLNKKVYSTLHFFRGSGNAEIPDYASGIFSFTATFPAPKPDFPSTSYAAFTTPSSNGERLTSVTPEAPGMVQLLAGLLPVAGVVGLRRRRKQK